MKKFLLWMLILLILAFVGTSFYVAKAHPSYFQQYDETDAPILVFISATVHFLADVVKGTPQPSLQRAEPITLGIIPVYVDDNADNSELPTTNEMMTEVKLAGDAIGTVLDYYTETVKFWEMLQSSLMLQQINLVFAKQGCVMSSTQFDGPSEEFLEAEKELYAQGVQQIVYVPCPTDETRLAKGRQEIRTALGTLRKRLFQTEMVSDNEIQEQKEENAEPNITEIGGTGNAQWRLTFLGIGPTESGQPSVAEMTYVFENADYSLPKTPSTVAETTYGFEEATNDFPALHFFIPYEVRVVYGASSEGFEREKGKEYFFSGEVRYLDAAAGNRWYEATNIDELKLVISRGPGPELVANLTTEEVNEQLDRWNYCEVDADCEAFLGECPFGCWKAVNKQFVQSAQQLISDRRENAVKNGNPQCDYACMQLRGVQCREQKCGTRTPLPNKYPAAVDDKDLERFREHPEDTREILQERRKFVDDYLNGTDYQGCQLSDNGKYVACMETKATVSIDISLQSNNGIATLQD